MNEVFLFWLMSFSAVFFVVDPFGAVPLYLSMTETDSAEKKKRIALKASFAGTIMLVAFALTGGWIFKVFGITLAAFKIAGGILLLLMSIDMLRAKPTRTRTSPEETQEGIAKDDVALIPLAIPMLAGPGSISTAMVLMGQASGNWLKQLGVILSILLTGILSYLVLRGGLLLVRFLKQTGLNVVARIMGLILAAIAMQFILDGLFDAYRQFFSA